jgi:hypothetical protein
MVYAEMHEMGPTAGDVAFYHNSARQGRYFSTNRRISLDSAQKLAFTSFCYKDVG